MSAHAAFRRQPVPQQFAQALRPGTLPAPTRGIIQHENEAFMGPGACIISDNWMPTLRGVRLRGGTDRWCDLHALDAVVPPVPDPARKPVISGFEYVSGNAQRMFAAQVDKVFDVTSTVPVLVVSGRTSGNYVASQLANLAGYWLLACNETGDPILRFNGISWVTLDLSVIAAWANSTSYAVGATAKDTVANSYWRCTVAHTSAAAGTFAADRAGAASGKWTTTPSDGAAWIFGPPGTPVEFGKNLSYVAKYRNRYFFIETKSMNLWYLPIDSVGGSLTQIPMSGAATLGGYLMFLASWSIDAGDGIDDKLVAVTSEGEALIFTGSNPADPNNWRQEGRYYVGKPMGINAHESVGGDLLILTVDGIVPVSQAITKSAGELELAMISRAIRRMWRAEANDKREHAWTIRKWDEFGGIFITFPGGTPGQRYALGMNNATGAFCRMVGWDAMCFLRLRADMFFGTQDGIIMQAERGGYDDGLPYVATLVGGWELFGGGSAMTIWHQARAIFASPPVEPFVPQLASTVDYIVTLPPPPAPGPDPGLSDVWDEGLWDDAVWDAPGVPVAANRNTMWVSIGQTGFAHAPIVQVTVAQLAKPDVELVAIGTMVEHAGVNV